VTFSAVSVAATHSIASLAPAGIQLVGPDFSAVETAVRTATGLSGLLLILLYSFLIAFVLPLPSEVVLIPGYAGMGLALPPSLQFSLVILVSGLGKATGSVFAFHLGQEAKRAGPIVRYLQRSRFEVIKWSENRAVELAREYGYAGLALALCVPGVPDTISIYAFAVLERDYYRFALATFVGSVGRLLVTMGVAGGAVSILGA
jgi:membrane protein YqaA with SNARE-associated domain